MPRLARKDLETNFLHVMVQGVNKEYIFKDKKNLEMYLNMIKENAGKYNYTIIAYCMMNNHAHFLIYTENINDLGKAMQKVNLLYVKKYNKEEGRCGVLFRNRYQTEPIYNMKYLINCIKYIHNNPVRAKMVDKCENYKYSSYKDYITNRGIAKSKIMNEIFGEKCDYAKLFKESSDIRFIDIYDENKEAYKEYVEEGIKRFKQKRCKEIFEILSDRNLFKELIEFLNDECRLKYVEIMNFFEIPRGTMDFLKKQPVFGRCP